MIEDSSNLETATFEREKWQAEIAFREREVSVQERAQATLEAQLELKRKEQARSGWRNPLVVAIIAATIAASGNAVVTVVNGYLQRQIEDQKSEQTRILEMIKTGDPDKAADNLQFLLDAGLLTNPVIVKKLRDFLSRREPGSGPTLPLQTFLRGRRIVGADDATVIDSLPPDSGIHDVAGAVGRLSVHTNKGIFLCTSFLVTNDIALTATRCIRDGATEAKLLMGDEDQEVLYDVELPPIEIRSNMPDIDYADYALLRIKGEPGMKHGVLPLRSKPPIKDQKLTIIMFSGLKRKLAVMGDPDCRVLDVKENVFYHGCYTGGGSMGAPIFNESGYVVGMQLMRTSDKDIRLAVRGDAVLRLSETIRTSK